MPASDSTDPRASRTPERVRRGRRPTLSLEAILTEAVALLDEAGEGALTFRTLAERLGTGVGSLYHYVAGRDELLDRATNVILGQVVDEIVLPDDPYAALRQLSMRTYLALQAHPWAGIYLMRDTGMQPNSMRLFDLFGRQSLKLDLTARQRFDAVSSLVSFVVGVGAEMRELPAAILVEGKSQAEYLHDYAEAWRALDPTEFPFIAATADEFEQHDDRSQFAAGVDLFLAGLAQQARD